MEPIRVARSFIAGDALAEVINKEYSLGSNVTCTLFSKMLRSQDNDHYKVMSDEGDIYVARIYQRGDHFERQKSDYEYELDWLNFLFDRDMPVSYPIQRVDGRFLGSMLAPEGIRYFALFSLAQGKNMSPNDQDQLFVCGQKMAQIHLVSNEFKTDYSRQSMDLDFLLNKPVQRIKEYWENKPSKLEQLDLLMITGEEAKVTIEELLTNEINTEDGWGPIGGDFHTASTYFDASNNPTFFNFDLCGPGWRSYDIATFLLNTDLIHQESADSSESFFAGYYSVRQLSQNEHEAIYPFMTIRRIWLTSLFTITQGLAGHTFIAAA